MYQIQKKRRSAWFYVILFFCAFSVGLGVGYAGVRMALWRQEVKAIPEEALTNPVTQKEIPDRAASATLEPIENVVSQAEETYLVQSQSGKVCVFTVDAEGVKRFSHNLAIELDALPEVDKKMFSEGITLTSKEELLSLLEDFGS